MVIRIVISRRRNAVIKSKSIFPKVAREAHVPLVSKIIRLGAKGESRFFLLKRFFKKKAYPIAHYRAAGKLTMF